MDINIYFILIVLLLGLSLMLAEILVNIYGALALSGLIICAGGIAMLVDNNFLSLHTAWSILAALATVNLLFIVLSISAAIKTRARKPITGIEAFIGQTATVINDFHDNEGWVLARGELWQAHAEQNLTKGTQVQVIEINGLNLIVR